MRIDFRAAGHWQELNEKVTDRLQSLSVESSGAESRIYQGLPHAMVEAVIGVSQLYPLKKKVFYFRNMNPYFEAAVMPLAKLGYQMIPLGLEVLAAPQEWVKTIERDALLVLYGVDDPLLGRVFDTRALEAALSEKSLMQIRVSHARHFYEGAAATMPRHGIYLYGLSPRLALACVGDRARFGAITADQLFYENIEQIDWSWFKAPTAVEIIPTQKWQAQLASAGGAQVLWADRTDRLFDRALIFWQDMDGHALIERLATLLEIQLQAPGFDSRLETLSLSRWGGVRTLDFYQAWDLEPNVLRGLVMISTSLRSSEMLLQKLSDARRSVLKEQTG